MENMQIREAKASFSAHFQPLGVVCAVVDIV